MNRQHRYYHFKYVMDLPEGLMPWVWFTIILLASTLFPKHAFATGPGKAIAFLIFGVAIIIIVNIFKLLILRPNKNLKFSLGTIFCVAFVEIFLIFLSRFPIVLILIVLKLLGYKTYEIMESYQLLGIIALAISYGLLAIVPNLFLVREKDQKLFEIITVPKKILHAAMLAFITPTIGAILIITS
jgi:hypothetical protein